MHSAANVSGLSNLKNTIRVLGIFLLLTAASINVSKAQTTGSTQYEAGPDDQNRVNIADDTLFGAQQIVNQSELPGPVHITRANVNDDGHVDVITHANGSGMLVWYANSEDGLGMKRVIDDSTGDVNHITTLDLNADGYDEVVASTQDGLRLVGYENKQGSFGAKTELEGSDKEVDYLIANDLDSDGDRDLVAYLGGFNQTRELVWYENTAEGISAQKTIRNDFDIEIMEVVDVNADGYSDIAYGYTDALRWIENSAGGFKASYQSSDSGLYYDEFEAADIEGDGDTDLFAVSDEFVYLYRNNGSGFEAKQELDSLEYPGNLHTADVDADGDLDLILESDFNDFVWYEQTLFGYSSQGTVHERFKITDMIPVDLNDDGQPELLGTDIFKDNLYSISLSNGGFGDFSILDPYAIAGVKQVEAVDMDRDGDLDLVAASENDGKFTWYENVESGFGQQKIIADSLSLLDALAAVDLNADGNKDVLLSGVHHGFAWYENTAVGLGEPTLIKENGPSIKVIRTGNINGDNYADVIVARGDSSLYWYENTGLGLGSSEAIETDFWGFVDDIAVGDIDNDGDDDIAVLGSYDGHSLHWIENTNTGFSDPQPISNRDSDKRQVSLTDYNGDGYADLIIGADHDINSIVVFENSNGSFGKGLGIASDMEIANLYTDDVDNDGRPDILANDIKNGRIVWIRNSEFGYRTSQVITTAVHGSGEIRTGDLDGDSDIDIFAASERDSKISWYANNRVATSVKGDRQVPESFTVYPNAPNPFNPTTQIKYEIPQPANVQITIYNSLGKKVASLVNERKQAGTHRVRFDASSLSSGVYFYRVKSASLTQTRKMLLIK